MASARRSLPGDDLVDDAERLGLRRRHVAAGDDHLHRRLRADQARQALRAAAARQDADQHLGQADLGARHGDPVVAGERMLEPAAERVAVDRSHHRLAARRRAPRRSAASDVGARLAELADVGAGDEAAAGADHHHRLDLGIGLALLQRLDDAVADAGAQRVDRRIVDGDDADAVLDVVPHERLVTHGASPKPVVSIGRRGRMPRPARAASERGRALLRHLSRGRVLGHRSSLGGMSPSRFSPTSDRLSRSQAIQHHRSPSRRQSRVGPQCYSGTTPGRGSIGTLPASPDGLLVERRGLQQRAPRRAAGRRAAARPAGRTGRSRRAPRWPGRLVMVIAEVSSRARHVVLELLAVDRRGHAQVDVEGRRRRARRHQQVVGLRRTSTMRR